MGRQQVGAYLVDMLSRACGIAASGLQTTEGCEATMDTHTYMVGLNNVAVDALFHVHLSVLQAWAAI